MMNQEEYLKLLLKLVYKDYYSCVLKASCKLLYVKDESFSRSRVINRIEGKLFIGLDGYYTNILLNLPDGFFVCQDKFTNGAMLVKHLPTSTN